MKDENGNNYNGLYRGYRVSILRDDTAAVSQALQKKASKWRPHDVGDLCL